MNIKKLLCAILISSLGFITCSLQGADTPSNTKSGDHTDSTTTGVVSFTLDLPEDALRVEGLPVPGSTADFIVSVDLELAEPVVHRGIPGEPRLPVLHRLVALPSGARVHNITVETGTPVEVDRVALVQWAEVARAGQQGPREPIPPSFTIVGKEAVFYPAADGTSPVSDYLTRASWPEKVVDWSPSGAGGNTVTVLQLEIAPVEWLPAQGLLLFHTQQDITIEYTLPKSQPSIKPVLADVLNIENLKTQVVNPGLLPTFDPLHIKKVDAPYLIITDNYEWSVDGVRGSRIDGDAVAELRRLADWKQKSGNRAKVVTVTDIVSGHYGDFSTGAADLPEIIRNFLKHARGKWNTYWVLLGGGAEIIPPRMVMSNASANIGHAFLLREEESPSLGRAYWDPGEAVVRIHVNGVTTGEVLYSMSDGTGFAYVGWPTSRDPGWGYATDETYRSPSFLPTEYLVVGGLPGNEAAKIHRALDENMIPTDLYYASVDDPLYGVPGQKDWDANGNGLYGQHAGGTLIDGVSLDPDLAVGRAPFSNGAEARAWVDRTLAYQRYELGDEFAEKLLLIGDNWGAGGEPARYVPAILDLRIGEAHVFPQSGVLSEANIHFHGPITFFERVINPNEWILVYQKGDSYFRVPYNRDASPTSGGYYFTESAAFGPPSETEFELFGSTVPIMSPTRFVKAFGPFETGETDGNVYFFFDNYEPDGVIEHKENVAAVLSTAAPSISEVSRLYKDWFDFPGGPDPSMRFTETKVRNWFGGNNLVSLAGHGSPRGCCGLDAFNLPWGPLSGVVYADSCLTARFAATDHELSLAEGLNIGNARGAVAYVGNTAYSWVGIGNDFEQLFWGELRRNDALAALHHSKAMYRTWNSHVWVNYSLNLFGDPSLRIWRSRPSLLDLDLPEAISPGTPLRVRVTSPGGEPLQFVRVTMTGRNVFENEITDLDGWVEFQPVFSPGVVSVTVAASGYVPFEGSVSVQPSP